jgi:peptide/nickel transport system substrate-binding protein
MKNRVAAVEVPDPGHVRFKLKEPWPDFLTFYGRASGAGWIVPRKYVEQVGDEGLKKAPIGAGPYKFVSFTPGVELVFEAFDQYWRKPPNVKRLVFKVIPEETTRLAALKRGEVDIAYSIRGELAEELQRTAGLILKPAVVQGVFNIYFADQWDPKSPWHDERVRRAASLAIDREGTNQALTLGYSLVTGNPVVADNYEFFWQRISSVAISGRFGFGTAPISSSALARRRVKDSAVSGSSGHSALLAITCRFTLQPDECRQA